MAEGLDYDGLSLDDALRWSTAGAGWYPAALRLENCQSFKLALDIAQNQDCYDWIPRDGLEESARAALKKAGVSDSILQSGGVDLCGYGAHLLENQSYTLASDGSGCIARTSQEFHYNYSVPTPEQPGMAMR